MWRTPSGQYQQYKPSGDSVPVITDIREWCVGKSGHLPFGQLQGAV
jgi:hypothetical protein